MVKECPETSVAEMWPIFIKMAPFTVIKWRHLLSHRWRHLLQMKIYSNVVSSREITKI